MLISKHELKLIIKQTIEEYIMADTNIADALKSIQNTLASNQTAVLAAIAAIPASTGSTPVDLTPVLTAVQAVSDKIDSIDTPTS
jgi:hypothetical protein